MADCGKRFGPRRLVCVRQAGHWGRHSHIRSARGIGVLLRTVEKGSDGVSPRMPSTTDKGSSS